MSDFKPFHSAVNRIPVLRRYDEQCADAGRLPEDLFADFAAPGHDHLGADRLSGSIDLEMTVRTPLVFGEQECGSVALPTDAAGRPVVPPTMVKGMVSRAYEAFTCSRFRVFGDTHDREGQRSPKSKHTDRLTFRGDPASALQLVPLRLGKPKEGGFTASLLQGDTMVEPDYRENGITYPTMRAANLQAGTRGHATLVLRGGARELERMAPHGKEIHCRMTLCLHGDRGRGARYAYWQVTHIRDDRGQFVEVFRIDDSVTTIEDLDDATGYVYRTTAQGDAPWDLFPRKHDERVFFDVSDRPQQVEVTEDALDAYRIVIDSYIAHREEEERLNIPDKKRHHPNRATAEARTRQKHLREDNSEERGGAGSEAPPPVEFHEGDLAYAVVDGSGDVHQLLPVMIGRRAYRVSPHELGESQRVLPVSTRDEASAADRLFGYVVPDADDGAAGGDVASRGRLVFGAVDASQATISTSEKVLSPLLQPKTTSARRFLTNEKGETPTNGEGGPFARDEYFAPGQFLGAAAYPVHRMIVERKGLDDSGFPRWAQESAVLSDQKQDNPGVRLTAKSWMRIGSRLRCTVSFSNLSEDELAALIWVLTPENLVPSQERGKGPGAVGFLRMGLGKPLGLGALEVRIADGGLRVIRGKDLSAAYEELSGCLSESDSPVDPSEYSFPKDLVAVLDRLPWIQALQRAGFGYSDGAPVRYMSLEENKANNQTDFKTGRPKRGRGLSPRDLHGGSSNKPMQVAPEERRNPYTRGPRYRRGR